MQTEGNAGTSQTKTCPACAEEVKEAAVVCRYCGHDLGSAQVRPQSPLNGLAVGALTAGLLGFLLPPVGAVIALVLGIVALRQIRRSRTLQRGKGLAISGIILSGVLTAVSVYLAMTGFFGFLDQGENSGQTGTTQELTSTQQLVNQANPGNAADGALLDEIYRICAKSGAFSVYPSQAAKFTWACPIQTQRPDALVKFGYRE